MVPLSIFLIFGAGQVRLRKFLKSMPLESFLEKYNLTFDQTTKISGTALFFTRETGNVQSYVTQTMFDNKIMYSDNIFISIIRREDPFGVIAFFKGDLASGLRIFEIHCGYMEVLNVDKILKNAGIFPRAIFYGLDEIVSKNIIWRFFGLIKRLVPNFAQFYKLPYNKLHGVVTLIEM
jgi:KUP system potassium uptake protein